VQGLCRTAAGPFRKGGGLVDAPGGWLAGAKSKYRHCRTYLPTGRQPAEEACPEV